MTSATTIKIDPTSLRIPVQGTGELIAEVTPTTTSEGGYEITWVSSNSDIAKPFGKQFQCLVLGQAEGTATISAIVRGAGAYAESIVTVHVA